MLCDGQGWVKPRVYNKVGQYVRIMSSPLQKWIKSAYHVSLASIISDVIYGFYLSMLRRRHFSYIGAYPEQPY